MRLSQAVAFPAAAGRYVTLFRKRSLRPFSEGFGSVPRLAPALNDQRLRRPFSGGSGGVPRLAPALNDQRLRRPFSGGSGGVPRLSTLEVP
jgi:hypothetical protein